MLKRELNIKKTREDFRKVAGIYDLWSRLTESRAVRKALQLAEIRNHQDILEVACGTGVVFEAIVHQNSGGHNTGIDLSPAMLAKAKKRLSGFDGNAFRLEEGNALHLDFSGDSFDILFNNYMVDLMPEESFITIAREFFRVLRPGGLAVMTTFSPGRNRVNRFWGWVAEKYPDLLTGCRPVDFKDSLRTAGFVIEEAIPVSQNTFPSEVIRARKPGKREENKKSPDTRPEEG